MKKRGIILAGLLCWILAPLERLPGHGVLGRVVQHHIVYRLDERVRRDGLADLSLFWTSASS